MRALLTSSWRRALLAAAFVIACSDATGPEEPLQGRISLRSVFAAGETANELRLTVDSIRVVITRAPGDTVAQGRSAFFDGQSLTWLFELNARNETLQALVELRGGAELLYTATASLTAGPDQGGQATVHDITVRYVGPPRTMAIAIADGSNTLTARGAVRALAPTALDGAGRPLDGKAFTWTSSQPGVATVDSAGRVTAVADGTTDVVTRVEGLERTTTITVAIAAVAGRSTLEVGPASVPADGVSVAAVLVRLFDANEHPLDRSGGTVTLGTSHGTLSAVTDRGDGTYVATLTALTTGTATVQAALDGTAIPGAPAVTFTPPPPVPAALELQPSSAPRLAALGATQQFSATVRDQYGHLMDALTIHWTSSAPAVATVDGTSGLVTATGNGAATITATLGNLIASTDITVEQAASAAHSVIAAGPSSVLADGTTPITVVVSLRDAHEHALTASGGTVSIESTHGMLSGVTDRGDGTYVATLTATAAGTATLSATLDGAPIRGAPVVEFAPMPPVVTTLEVTPASAPSLTALGATRQLATIAHDQYGALMDGVAVTWTSSAPTVASIDAAGLVTAVGNGAATITATAGGVSAAAAVVVAQAPSPAHSTITAAPASVMADGTSPIVARVTLRDARGNALSASAGVVTMQATHGILSAVTDHGDGTYTATLTATVAGATVVRAALGGTAIPAEAAAEFTPLPPVVTTLQVSPAAAPSLVALGETQQFTAVAFDQYGAVMPGVGLLWTSSAPAVLAVDAATGLATAVGNGTATITASAVGASHVNASASLSVAQRASLALSTITAAPGTVPADTVTPATVIVALRDARGNALATSGGTVVMATTHGTLSAVTDRGDGTYAAQLTAAAADDAVVRATLDGAPIVGEAPVTFTRLPSVLVALEVAPATSPLTALGASHAFSVTARDQYGDPMPGVVVSWSSDASAVATVDPATGVATATGNGTATITATPTGGSAVRGTASLTVGIMADPSRATLVASAERAPADGSTAVGLEIRLFDARGNALTHSGGTVALQASIGTVSPVTDHGDGRYTASVACGDVGFATVTGTVNGVAIGDSTTIEFWSTVPALTTIEVAAAPAPLASLGATHQFTAVARDQFGATMDGLDIRWSSDAPQVATVDAVTGLATAVGNGTATLRASVDGIAGVSGSATLAVAQAASAAHATVTAAPTALLADGVAAATVVVRLYDARGNALTAGGAPVAIVASRGTLSGITDRGDGSYAATLTSESVGLATVSATLGATPIAAQTSVEFLPVLTSIDVSPSAAVLEAIGATRAFGAVARDRTGVPMPDVVVTWSSSDPSVVSVDAVTGVVTALRNGSASIRAAAGAIAGEAVVVVQQAAAGVRLSASTLELASLGASAQLTATVHDALDVPMAGQPVAWTSSDAAVASVAADGTVTAHANGTAVITATSGVRTATANVTVRQRAATVELAAACEARSMPCAAFDALGTQLQFAAMVRDARGQLIAAPEIAWSSSDTAVAVFDQAGLATTVGNGTVRLAATVDGVTREFEVTVRQVVVGIRFDATELTITGIGNTGFAPAFAYDRNGNTVEDAVITWESWNDVIATVDQHGVVTARARGGSKIFAHSNGFTAKVTLYIL